MLVWWRNISRSEKLAVVGVLVGVLGILPTYLAFFADGDNGGSPAVASATTERQEPEQLLSFAREELGDELAATCEVAGPDKPFNNELQAIDCIPPGPMGFSLALYKDVHTMSKDYYFYMPDSMARSDDSRKGCQMGKPSEGKWNYGDKDTVNPAGRLKCYTEGGDAVLEWTIADRKVYGVAFRLDGNLKALYSWWERTWPKKH